MSDFVQKALAALRSKLLDLTRRNRLLNYKESARSIRVVDELPDEVFRTLVRDEKEMQFLPAPDESAPLLEVMVQHELPQRNGPVAPRHRDTRLQTPFGSNVLERRCKKLLQESRSAIDETGSNLLHLAIGFLEWYEADDSEEVNRAPLILVPVRIDRSRIDHASNCYTYVISYTGEDIETNLSLAEKLNIDFDLILPALDEDVFPEGYLDAVTATVARRQRWRVACEMVLGLFSFSKLLMYKDLDPARWPTGSTPVEHPNISCILGGRCEGISTEEQPYGEEYDIDRDTRAITLPLITDADSSQTSVIMDVVHHRESLVVEGPPGTGKSQTITNLIAAALHQGLSVLFVAEKKAALEVVRSRLDHAGLGDFCLELHSHKTQKGQLHSDIGRRLKKTFPDTKTLDRELSDLAQERGRLMAYSSLVNSVVGPNGETVYDIFWATECCRSDLKGQPPRFAIGRALQLTHDQLNERVNLLKDVARLRQDLPDQAIKVWQNFIPATVLPADVEAVTEILSEIVMLVEEYHDYLDKSLAPYSWPAPFTIRHLRSLTKADGSMLNELPEDSHPELASALVLPANLATLEELATSIGEYRRLTTAAGTLVDNVDVVTPALAQQIAHAASDLKTIGYGGGTAQELTALAEKQNSGCELLARLAEAFDGVQSCFAPPLRTLVDCERLFKLQQVLDEAPAGLPDLWHDEHALQSASETLQKARPACDELNGRLKEHGQFFLLRYLPPHSDLVEIAKGLRNFRGSFIAFLSSEYRELRRMVKRLLADPKQVRVPDLVEKIEELADTLAAIEEVRTNEVYRQKLGPLYLGIKTDWAKVEDSISWGQALAVAVGGPTHAYNLAPRLPELIPAVATATALVREISTKLAPLRVMLHLSESTPIGEVRTKLVHERDRLLSLLQPIVLQHGLANIEIASLFIAAQAFLAADRLVSSLDETRYRKLLKTEYAGVATDTARLLRTGLWLARLREQGNLPDEVVFWVAETGTAVKCQLLLDLLVMNRKFWDSCALLLGRLSNFGEFISTSVFVNSDHEGEFHEMADLAASARDMVLYLVTWGDYRRTLARADGLGLQVVTEAIDSERISPDESAAIYLHAVYDSMSREIIAQNPDLASFTRAEFEGVRERYASIDRQIMKNTRARIAHIAACRPVPRGVGYGPVKGFTDLALVERELVKQKRHIPIRQLVHRAGRALQGLKPCFMMSPLSVAQYLEPGQIGFNLVIMDEASQLKPEDALGAIGRAQQLIVVGDPNQLPPTSFFDRTDGVGGDDQEASAVQDTESILDICITSYRRRRLRWHYRSEHESLIAFSNNRFYDDDLIIFPSPQRNNRDYGVHRHYIENATYQKGRNRAEAEAVARAVIAHFRTSPSLSLGVATFNREQAELVLDVLDRLQKENIWLESLIKQSEQTEEPFFVKNLENVQGDERDVMIVSTTYGPDSATGKVYQRFGPVAGDTGWRRLNVIFTRAKKRVELFTSMRAADIKLGDAPSKGILALKGYLEYAETGFLPDYGTIGGREPDSDFEIAVARHLNGYGYRTVAQVGVTGFFIDIGVLHPERDGEFVLGIECDGAAYHSSKSVRDRDRLRQEVLERKGWRIHRIWSTDWYKNRDREIQRLLIAVRQAVDAHVSVSEQSAGFEEEVAAAIASVQVESKQESPKTATAPQPAAEPAKVVKGLREELVEYRQANIVPSFPDQSSGVLREEILDRLVKQMPTTREEFYSAVPMTMRQQTDSKQMQFIDDILEIIDAYS